MKQENEVFKDCYSLLQQVLLDAFNVATLYHTPPYQDISKIDLGMRAAVWTHYNDDNTKIRFDSTSQSLRVLIIKSNLGFYNILITLSSETTPDFISIGPFRDEELSPSYFTQILKDAHIAPYDVQRMRYIYENMPLIQLDSVVNVSKHILGNFIPEFKNISPELMQYSEQKRAIEMNAAVLDERFIEHSSRYQQLLFQFLDYLKLGDNENAKKALHSFWQESNLISSKNMREYKLNLLMLNDYCHMALMQTSIHPFHILKQSNSVRAKTESMTSFAKLEQMPGEICHKYCILVKNYANPDYSKLTKDIIAYIQLHLEEKLSLNFLAGHFGRNPSVLSNSFSKETGQTLTKYIHQVRIKEALHLFNTTDMSVSEIALAVGYQDFSYFSKVFTQNIGMSPREYRQKR